MAICLKEAVLRHASTSADGALIGRHSNQVMKHYEDLLLSDLELVLPAALGAALRQSNMAWSAACEFHQIQISGQHADRRFPSLKTLDDMLRWLQPHVEFGSG